MFEDYIAVVLLQNPQTSRRYLVTKANIIVATTENRRL